MMRENKIGTAIPFWKQKTMSQMNLEEWESLCDGCGKCCLNKLELEETGEILYTDVCCRLFCTRTCRCLSYENRLKLVPTCMLLTPDKVEQFHWLPANCAYRLVAEGKELPPWHYLVSGDRTMIHRLGLSVKGKVISEEYVSMEQMAERVVNWI
jgi:uncharacterized protein